MNVGEKKSQNKNKMYRIDREKKCQVLRGWQTYENGNRSRKQF